MKTKIIFGLSIFLLICYFFIKDLNWLFQDIVLIYFSPFILIFLISLIFLLIKKYIFKYNTKIINYWGNSLIINCVIQLFLIILLFNLTQNKVVERDALISDLKFFQTKIEEIDPNPYWYISKADLTDSIDILNKRLSNKTDMLTATKEMMKCIALIHDGHTNVELFSLIAQKAILGQVFPYSVLIDSSRVFVSKSFSSSNMIPIGSELISINNVLIGNVLKNISAYQSYETQQFRIKICGDLFPFLIGFEYNFKPVDVEYRNSSDNTIHKAIIKSSLSDKFRLFKQIMSVINKENSFSVLPDKIGYLEIASFMRDFNQYKEFLHSSFDSIQKRNISNLIIDIRMNGGGSDNLGIELFQYLCHEPFQLDDSAFIKVSKPTLENEGETDTSLKLGTIIPLEFVKQKIKLRHEPLRFRGKIYLLTSGMTFSSATVFASAFKNNNIGTVVGSETGGAQICCGNGPMIYTPNLHVPISTSAKMFYLRGGTQHQQGVVPHICIKLNQYDLLKNKDKILDLVIELIKEK